MAPVDAILRTVVGLALIWATGAQAFSFADEEAKDKAAAAPKATRPAELPAACRERLKNERVLVLVAERGNQGVNADQGRYGMHFQSIDRRLGKQGMRT